MKKFKSKVNSRDYSRTDLNKISWRQRKQLKSKKGEMKLIRQMRQLDNNRSSLVEKDANDFADERNQLSDAHVLDDANNASMDSSNVEHQLEESVSDVSASASATERTVSMALPGTILNNAQSAELSSYLAGQIARAAAVFRIDEIVVFDEFASLTDKELEAFNEGLSWVSVGAGTSRQKPSSSECNFKLARILQFLECPQYLRRRLFPLQNELKFAGLLNPLDCPHHMRSDEVSIPYREAVVIHKPAAEGKGSYCDAGLPNKDVQIDRVLEPGIRVTLKLKSLDIDRKKVKASVVSPRLPKTESSIYWGYTVRLAKSLGKITSECPFPGGYDLTIGTSERGSPINKANLPAQYRHALIVFGGLKGLEACAEADEELETPTEEMFDFYLNSCPRQGSRTIRTEEAILITLSSLAQKLNIP